MTVIATHKLPSYFLSLDSILPNGKPRWEDELTDSAPHVIQMQDLNPARAKLKSDRNIAYSKWLASFFVKSVTGDYTPLIKPKTMSWQVIQVMTRSHSENNHKDWWGKYEDALFRVFLQPETVYDKYSGEHKQWYLLSPEDSYLVNRYEMELKHPGLEPRDYNGRERFLSANKLLRRARLIPVECCRHWRHETTAGALPEGL